MILTDNLNVVGVGYGEDKSRVIEDELTRTRRLRKFMNRQIDAMKKNKAPDFLMDKIEYFTDMTYKEYMSYTKIHSENAERVKKRYAKANPLEKDLVDAIYNKTETLPYNFYAYIDFEIFNHKLGSVEIVGDSHFFFGLYDDIIKHNWHLYQEKYKTEGQKDLSDQPK